MKSGEKLFVMIMFLFLFKHGLLAGPHLSQLSSEAVDKTNCAPPRVTTQRPEGREDSGENLVGPAVVGD